MSVKNELDNFFEKFLAAYQKTEDGLPKRTRRKDVDQAEKTYQKRVVDEKGNISWEPGKKIIPAHKGLKARSSCPPWVK